MDLKGLSLGEKIAAASGAALFLFLFVSWIEGQNAWELFDIVDVLLAILALAAVALPVAKAASAKPPLKPSNKTMLTRVGAVAVIFILAYFLEAFGSAQVGIWLSLLAAIGIFYGAVTMSDDEASGRRRGRTRPRTGADAEDPPPGMEARREGARFGGDVEPGSPAGGSIAGGVASGGESEGAPSRGADRPRRRADFGDPDIEFEPTEVRDPPRPPEGSSAGNR